MLSFVRYAAGNVAQLRRNEPRATRWTLLRTYVRIKAREYARIRLGRAHADGVERLFGRRIQVLDYAWFVSMFEDIFIRRDYDFRTGLERPRILDCGAHIGLATLFFKRLYPEAEIVAFEPDPAKFAVLRANVEGNALRGVELANVALWDAEGTVELRYDPDEPGSPLATASGWGPAKASTQIAAVPLSRYLTGPVDLVKMDIEGAETAVLAEVARAGKLGLIGELAVEYHHHTTPEDDSFSKLLSILEENGMGYQVTTIQSAFDARGAYRDIFVRAYRK